MWLNACPSKEKQSFVIASNLAVAGTWPSLLTTIDIMLSLPILVLPNLKEGTPSFSTSVGFKICRLGNVPSPLSSKVSLPVLDCKSPDYTIASKIPPYYFISSGLKLTDTYLCLWGSMIKVSGEMLNANPSLLDYVLGLTLNLTVQGTLFGFIILNLSVEPWGSLPAIIVPNQNRFS